MTMPMDKRPINRCDVELRDLQNTQSEKDMILEGTAAVFEKPTVIEEYDGIEYKEVIDRHAFDNSDFSYCCLKYNHANSSLLLARTRNNSLSVNIDDVGLKFHAKLFNTTNSRDVYTIVKEGGLDQCSFAFTVKRSEYDKLSHTRRILEIDKVFDISIVDVPAYGDTHVEARSFFELERSKDKLESEILKRKRLELLLHTI